MKFETLAVCLRLDFGFEHMATLRIIRWDFRCRRADILRDKQCFKVTEIEASA